MRRTKPWTSRTRYPAFPYAYIGRRSTFRTPAAALRLAELETQLANPAVWTDHQKYSELSKEAASLRCLVSPIESLRVRLEFASELLSEGLACDDLEREAILLEEELASIERKMASPDDDKPLYLTISAGNGGHEACAWVGMLLRMYEKYARRCGLEIEMIDVAPYEPDGLRSVTVRISGNGAFKAFRGEDGVHRLSRVSPYDQADRRQTSHAKVKVELVAGQDAAVGPDDLEVSEAEVDVKTCCGGGPGGQKINKTAIVAIVKHKQSGIIVRCQATRSQQKNREMAMEILKSKLWAKMKAVEDAKEAEKNKKAPKADFGNRTRSYVLSQHPLVQDHRTGKKVADVAAVMDGRVDLLL